MTYPISELDGILPGASRIFKSQRIRTTDKLLETAKGPKGRKALSEETGVDEKEILRCVTMADRLRVKGVGREAAELLELAGVKTVRDLKYRNPVNLATAMRDASKKRKLERVLPSEKVIGNWIENAKKLKNEIRYK